MKKKLVILLALVCALLSACSVEGKDLTTKAPRLPIAEKLQGKLKPGKMEETYNPGIKGILAQPLTDVPEELFHYDSTCFYFGDEEWFLDIYTSAPYGSDGYYEFDDQNRFYIRARYNEDQFVLFDDQVQLGFPEIDVYDDGKWLHIVMTDIRTASFSITDYSFLMDDYYFTKNELVNATGINYMTRLDVK